MVRYGVAGSGQDLPGYGLNVQEVPTEVTNSRDWKVCTDCDRLLVKNREAWNALVGIRIHDNGRLRAQPRVL